MSRFAFLAALAIAAPASAQTQYFGEIDDLPMPEGFAIDGGAGALFAAGGARIVLAQARGAATPAAVREFYLSSLPALGWAFSPDPDALVFLRGRERLTLNISAAASGAVLRVEWVQLPAR